MQKLIILFISIFFITQISYAAEETETVSRFSWGEMSKNISASYSAWLLGPSLKYLDGDENGKGTNLSLRHYPALGYKLGTAWYVSVTQEMRQYWRPEDPKNPNRQDFEFRDPYISSSFPLWKSERFGAGLSARVRYYIPASPSTYANIGKATDAGHGTANLRISPNKKFLDGKLNIKADTNAYVRFAKNPAGIRENYYFSTNPAVVYAISQKVDLQMDYYTGFVRHTTDGKWSKLNDPFLGQTISASVRWSPNRKLSMSPAVSWGRNNSFRLDRTDISLFADYFFL